MCRCLGFILLNFLLVFFFNSQCVRSIFRPKDPNLPRILTRWDGNSKTYSFGDYHLEEQTIFEKFDYKFFMNHLLPEGRIKFRNENKYITGKEITQKINYLLGELYERKKKFRDFQILKNKDFNGRIVCGNLVLKFKKYPFVVKLFIETPDSFVKPFSKGWQPACFFLMSGGINRYLSGFTRIKNMEIIKERIKNHDQWSKLDFPRKWFWLAKNQSWFELSCQNIGEKTRTIKLPSIYAIIADAIEADKEKSVENLEDPKFALKLCYYLDNRLDPHIENFMIEKNTGKIVIVDTEHFPSMVGLKEKTEFSSYTDWYMKLSWKALTDTLTRHKKCKNDLQKKPIRTLELN